MKAVSLIRSCERIGKPAKRQGSAGQLVGKACETEAIVQIEALRGCLKIDVTKFTRYQTHVGRWLLQGYLIGEKSVGFMKMDFTPPGCASVSGPSFSLSPLAFTQSGSARKAAKFLSASSLLGWARK